MKKIFTLLFAAVGLAVSAGNTVKYDFENYEQDKNKYYTWFELAEDNSKLNIWGTGNTGYYLAKVFSGGAKEGDFPTELETNGRTGACVKLVTKDSYTMFSPKTPIAPGNMFLGSFELDINNPLNSTKFGIAYSKKPLSLSFYYKYKAGEKVTDVDRKEVAGKVDKGTAYAVLYDNLGGTFQANGADILTNENIVGIANAGELGDADEWTLKSVDFEYTKDVDADKLAAGGYNFALVFSSSINGAAFEGAIGSVMYVDDVVIECEPETKEFVGDLNVKLNGTPFPTESNTSIYITEQNDGKYTLCLKNFSLTGIGGVGTIVVPNVEGTEADGKITLNSEQTITIAEGDDNSVDWVGPQLGPVPVKLAAAIDGNNLTANIDIPFGVLQIVVDFNGTVTGISNVVAADKKVLSEGIYNINGVKVNDMRKGGVYILRMADGTTKKVIKK